MSDTTENLKKEVAKNYQQMSKISNLEHSIVKMKQHGKSLKRQLTKERDAVSQLKKEMEFINSSKEVLQKIVNQFEDDKSGFAIEVGMSFKRQNNSEQQKGEKRSLML